jgi:hypothetical protein
MTTIFEIEEKIRQITKFNPNSKIWNIYDFIFFFVLIGAILTIIFLLPEKIKYYFILQPSNNTLISIFLSNYTHTDFNHFIQNLIIYWIIILLLLNLETNKKLFYQVSAFLFIILPFMSSFAVIYYISGFSSLGFSAIVSGFMGYLIYAVYNYLKNIYKLPLNYHFPFLILSINLTIMVIFNLQNVPLFLKITLIVISTFLIFINMENIKQIVKIIISKLNIPVKKCYTNIFKISYFLMVFVFLFSLPVLIPSEIVNEKMTINILSHYVGYCFGALIPFFLNGLLKFFKIFSLFRDDSE